MHAPRRNVRHGCSRGPPPVPARSRLPPAGLWLTRREELGHPLGLIAPAPAPPAARPSLPAQLPAADLFVLEVGTEELPPDDVEAGLEQLRCAGRKLRGEFGGAGSLCA